MNKYADNEYFLSYGLVKDPFQSHVIDRNIFLTPEINRRLKLIRQHIKEAQNLLLITSARGAGKSLLAQKLLILKEPGWRISLTRAHENMNSEALAYSIVQQLLEKKNGDATKAISMLHKYLEQSFRESLLPVIVIDGADELPFETLQFVLQLADLRYNEAFFRIVLFANESITENLTRRGLNELAEDTIDIIAMPCFSQGQVPAYLKSLFSSCGESIDPPFSESEYEYLYRASGGLPGGINTLARQLMLDKLNKDRPPKSYGSMAALLSLLLLALAGYQYYEYSALMSSRIPSRKLIQQNSAENTVTKDNLVRETSGKSMATEDNSDQTQLSSLHDSLSLKLSDLLTGQSTQVIESPISP